jgi:hypothetical protein
MREQEMRTRVFQFLKARMRNMIMPATVGIGLAVGGCAKEGVVPVYGTPSWEDASSSTDIVDRADAQAAPADAVADTSQGRDVVVPEAVPVYGSDVSLLDRDAEAVDSRSADQGKIDSTAPDGGTDVGGVITKYMALTPDAGRDAAPVVRYLAQQPREDAGIAMPLYNAPMPS